MTGGHPEPDYRAIWESKPSLRAVYADIYKQMLEKAANGRILEIGGGSGNFKDFAPTAIASDITFAPWLDLVCDAQRLPFAKNSFGNVVMVDVLHHVENPVKALRGIADVLAPGGRFIMCEPGITPLSGLFYKAFHQEPVDMSVDPMRDGDISPNRHPWDSNQAIPTLLTTRFRGELAKQVPELRLVGLDFFSFVAYPLSGGFKRWSLLPIAVARPLLALEWSLRALFGRLAGFRLLAVYEKMPGAA